MKNFHRLILTAAFALAAFSTANAQASVTVGQDESGNCLPFGCAPLYRLVEHQQVYAASAFSGMQTINSLSFYTYAGGALDGTTFTVSLSTTSKSVEGLDTFNLSNNLGSNNTLIGTFKLSGTAPAILTLSGATFDYDPSAGNLLLDIAIDISDASNNLGSVYFQGGIDPLTSRAYQDVSFSRGDDFGLKTTFDFVSSSDVPEPMTPATLGLGLIGIAVARRLKRRTGSSPSAS